MSETAIRKRMYDLAVSEVLDNLMGDDPEPTQEGRILSERTTGYQAVEFFGDGDPMFGGKADDRPLTTDGVFSSQYNQDDIAVFKTAQDAQEAGDRAPKRDGGKVGVVPIYDGEPEEKAWAGQKRRGAVIIIEAETGDVSAARGAAGDAIRSVLGVKMWQTEPHFVTYETVEKRRDEGLENPDPRYLLDVTNDELDAVMKKANKNAKKRGFDTPPFDVYHD